MESSNIPIQKYQQGMRGEPTKADVLQYLTCWLCKGVYRDAHTINECMCTYCKGCIFKFFGEHLNRNKCPQCNTELGGKPTESLVRDITLQSIVDWLIPDFKERDDKLKSQLLKQINERRAIKGTLRSSSLGLPKGKAKQLSQPATSSSVSQGAGAADEPENTSQQINFEFKLLPFPDDDQHLRMPELPKKLKFANKNKTILTVKKHIHNYLREPIDNIELLCKNFPVADSHSLEYIKKTKWQNQNKVMVLQYKRKRRIMQSNSEK